MVVDLTPAKVAQLGDEVQIDSYEGFGGRAIVVQIEDYTRANSRCRVRMLDGSQPDFWTHDDEVTEVIPKSKPYDSRVDTAEHVRHVRHFLRTIENDLARRAAEHDRSKFLLPEVEVFDEMTPKLAKSTYGSDEYRSFLAAMKPALDHHYAANDHHPEHFPVPNDEWIDRLKEAREEIERNHTGRWATDSVMVMDADLASRVSRIRSMSLVQLVEMLCDWKAATLHHNDGDIRRSIEINQRRFGYSDELKAILLNTVPLLEKGI